MISLEALWQIYMIGQKYFTKTFIIILLAIVGTTVVLRHRKRIVAFAVITGKYLHYFAVKQDYQGKGYGSLLFKKVLPKVDRLRVAPDNHKAIGLYEKNGFKVIKETGWFSKKRLLMQRIGGM